MGKPVISMIALLFAGTAMGQDAAVESAQRCAQIQDSLQRLVCFDRAFPARPPGTPMQPAQAAAPVAAAPPPPVTVVAQPAPQEFGAETLKRKDADRQEDEAPRAMHATVQAVREIRPSVYVITLDNGQVWQQMDMDVRFQVRVGDTVELNRGRMGGYQMVTSNRGGSAWVRVNRLK